MAATEATPAAALHSLLQPQTLPAALTQLLPVRMNLKNTRLQVLFINRTPTIGTLVDYSDLLGGPNNPLASIAGSTLFLDWHKEYRIARDNLAYHREDFRTYYGELGYPYYWNEAEVATELQRHHALLKVLRFKCECVRMAKVSYALSQYHLLPEHITTICRFLGVPNFWVSPLLCPYARASHLGYWNVQMCGNKQHKWLTTRFHLHDLPFTRECCGLLLRAQATWFTADPEWR